LRETLETCTATDRAGEASRAHGRERDGELQEDEDEQSGHSLGERHGFLEEDRREGRAQRDRDDEIERVELGERALAREPGGSDRGMVLGHREVCLPSRYAVRTDRAPVVSAGTLPT
jgi:hypothetical protein